MRRKLKKIALLIIINIFVLLQCLPVNATDDLVNPMQTYLSIETKLKYENMMQSYQKGYEPIVEDEKVILVLPLKVEKGVKLDSNKLTASIKVNDGTTIPFKMRIYEKVFNLETVKSKSGKSQELYLVTFSLPLNENRINGSYPVTIQTKYKVKGQNVVQDFGLYINIKDGAEAESSSSTESKNTEDNLEVPMSEPAVSLGGNTSDTTGSENQENSGAPKIVVTKCSVSPEKPIAGQEMTFQLELENKSKMEAKNLNLSFDSESGEIVPIGMQNSIFIDTIKAGGSQTVSFTMKAQEAITKVNQKITLSLKYVDKNGADLTDAQILFVKLGQPISVLIDKAVINAEVESGKKTDVTIKVFNTGNTNIKNCMCSLDVDGLTDGGITFIGDIEPGASKQGKLTAAVTQKSLGKEGVTEDEKYGSTEGTLTVTYEDPSGTSYQEERSVRTKIKKSSKDDSDDKKSVKRSSQWSVSLVIGMLFIYIMTAIVLLIRKKRQP